MPNPAKRCAGKIPVYGGKNKSGLMAEKKLANRQIRELFKNKRRLHKH